MRRLLLGALVALVLLALIAVAGIGWYYSGEILVVEDDEPPVYDTAVVAVNDGAVLLADTEGAGRPGTWGLDAGDAYGRVGNPLAASGEGVARPFQPVHGEIAAGDDARLDGYAYPADPARTDFDFTVDEVDITAPLGVQPAWLVEGDPSRWAVFVHGRGGGRHECFRALPTFVAREFSALCVSYRNDPETPADPDGIYRQGAREWEDVEPAVRFALDQGAEELVLVGYSMGGQITANLLRHSRLAAEVDAVVWDSPLLDWGPVIALAARDRGVPDAVVPLGMAASALRAKVRYDELNQIAHADEFDVPILLFHGTDDTTVPVSVSDRFAEARPDLVTYERVEGADHVASWNVDRSRYEGALGDFLDEHVAQ